MAVIPLGICLFNLHFCLLAEGFVYGVLSAVLLVPVLLLVPALLLFIPVFLLVLALLVTGTLTLVRDHFPSPLLTNYSIPFFFWLKAPLVLTLFFPSVEQRFF